ncbi:unnamed protein product, partial [Allacma fusca]
FKVRSMEIVHVKLMLWISSTTTRSTQDSNQYLLEIISVIFRST